MAGGESRWCAVSLVSSHVCCTARLLSAGCMCSLRSRRAQPKQVGRPPRRAALRPARASCGVAFALAVSQACAAKEMSKADCPTSLLSAQPFATDHGALLQVCRHAP